VTPIEDYLAACVQFDVQTGDVAANRAAMQSGIEEAVEGGARLCVLPELWSTSFCGSFGDDLVRQAADADAHLCDLTRQHGIVAVGSAIERQGDRIFNTATVFQRGERLGAYRKIHLFSPILEHKHHARGDRPTIVDTECGRIGLLICYDLRFPELARYYFRAGAEILAVPGQWPEARAQHWRTLLRARAIENELFVVGCNRTGQSESPRTGEAMSFLGDGRIVDPTGEVISSGAGEAGAIVGAIELRKVRTMRRILPLEQDQRPEVYKQMLDETYASMVEKSRRDVGTG
jgi:omega-amidase